MDVDFQRRIDQVAGPPLCWLFTLASRLRRDPSESITPRRILVILLSEMGSLVLARPMLERLKDKYPDASLHALVFEQNREVVELLGLVPAENIVSVSNRSFGRLASDSLRAIRQLRRLGIDTVIDCELFSRVSALFSYASGAALRAGFHRHTQEGLYRGDFINRPVLYNPYLHMSEQFLNLAEAIDSEKVPRVKRRPGRTMLRLPALEVDREEMTAVEERFAGDFPQVAGKRLVLLYAGGGLLPVRAWPLSHFCEVAADLLGNGYAVGIVGLAQDKDLARSIQAHCDSEQCIDLTGYTKTVRELMLIFHLADLLITNDGGPGHFASMTPIHSIVLFGPESPTLYASLDPKATNFFLSLSCSPCLTAYNHRKSPCDGNNLCLKLISPGKVLEKAYEVLNAQRRVVLH